MSSVDTLESEELLKGSNKNLEEISSTISSYFSSSSTTSDGDDEENDDGIIMIDLPSPESQSQIFNISSTPPTEGPSQKSYSFVVKRYGEALKKCFTSRHKYEVFLSFRGADTRKAFTDHLYAALLRTGIHTFRDECDLERGENITSELHKAIEESMIAIIVFSKEYTYSEWCLDELVRILERKNATGLKVLPIFYDVQPSQIRNQSRSLGNVFSKTEQMDKVKEWKTALKEVADLGGMVLQNEYDGHESKFIQEVVAHVKSKLNGDASNGLKKKLKLYISLVLGFAFFVLLSYFGYPFLMDLIYFRKHWGEIKEENVIKDFGELMNDFFDFSGEPDMDKFRKHWGDMMKDGIIGFPKDWGEPKKDNFGKHWGEPKRDINIDFPKDWGEPEKDNF